MPLEDINQATFLREAERTLPESERAKAVANFAKLKTAGDRLTAFRKLRGGSVIAAPSTKLGEVKHTR